MFVYFLISLVGWCVLIVFSVTCVGESKVLLVLYIMYM